MVKNQEFQFSPSHRGHRGKHHKRQHGGGGFNSRPRTEGITWDGFTPFHLVVSILALAQRASDADIKAVARSISFNSRPRTEGIQKGLNQNGDLAVSILALAQRASAKIDKYFHPILRILHNISTFGRITPLLKSALYPIWLKYRNIFCANLQDKSQRLGFAHSIHAKSKHNYPILLICQFFSKCFYS